MVHLSPGGWEVLLLLPVNELYQDEKGDDDRDDESWHRERPEAVYGGQEGANKVIA